MRKRQKMYSITPDYWIVVALDLCLDQQSCCLTFKKPKHVVIGINERINTQKDSFWWQGWSEGESTGILISVPSN